MHANDLPSARGSRSRIRTRDEVRSSRRGEREERGRKKGKKGEQWINYLVFVDQHGSQVAVEEKLVRLDVDRALSPSFAAQRPLGIYQSPKRRSCKQNEKKNTINFHESIDFLRQMTYQFSK